jgi:hypothetical protein
MLCASKGATGCMLCASSMKRPSTVKLIHLATCLPVKAIDA